MAHTHEFDCTLCGAHLDSPQELDQHNREFHPDTMRGSQASSSAGPQGQSSPADQRRGGDRRGETT